METLSGMGAFFYYTNILSPFTNKLQIDIPHWQDKLCLLTKKVGANNYSPRLFVFHIVNYNAFSTISSTTNGSSNVEVSPKLVISPSAILRKIRRMILPERVFGKPETN